MKEFTIITEHGNMVVQITVKSDKVFDKLGMESEKVETAIANMIGMTLLKNGGSTKRPTKWDN